MFAKESFEMLANLAGRFKLNADLSKYFDAIPRSAEDAVT